MSAPRAAVDGVRDLARDVQRFGLLSATSVVERYVELVDRAISTAPVAGDPQPTDRPDRPSDPLGDGDPTALVDSAARVADAYLELLQATARQPRPTGSGDRLVLDAVPPGSTAQAPLYVHNPGPDPTSELTVVVGSLVTAGGACLSASSVSCAPARVDSIGTFGSVRLDVTVQVPSEQPPGTYHGFAVGSLCPEEPLRVTVEVLAP